MYLQSTQQPQKQRTSVTSSSVGLAPAAAALAPAFLAVTEETALRMAVRPPDLVAADGGGTGCGGGDIAISSPARSFTSEPSTSPSARDGSKSLVLLSCAVLGVRRSALPLALDFFAPLARPLTFLPETGSVGGGSDSDPLRLSWSGSGDWLELDARPLALRDDRRRLLASDCERCNDTTYTQCLAVVRLQLECST